MGCLFVCLYVPTITVRTDVVNRPLKLGLEKRSSIVAFGFVFHINFFLHSLKKQTTYLCCFCFLFCFVLFLLCIFHAFSFMYIFYNDTAYIKASQISQDTCNSKGTFNEGIRDFSVF